ncbi:MAG: DUF6088 family protein [Clostridiales bacterium]|nr:DUF6088 family protein [Clostridiales bacterium]
MKRPDYTAQVEKRIENDPYGTTYVSSDFTDITNKRNINMIFLRLEEKGLISQAIRGVYYKHRYSEILGKNTGPYLEQLAEAIARNHGWSIVPSGNQALNDLGVSTQVPAVWKYASDGPSKVYMYDDIPIIFKHTPSRDITNMSFMTAYVIQALKALGKEQINDKTINKIASVLTSDEKNALLRESNASTSWIYENIKIISRR